MSPAPTKFPDGNRRLPIQLLTRRANWVAAMISAPKSSLPLSLNVEGGGDTRVDLEIESVAIGAKLI